jgi:hypothetical protein
LRERVLELLSFVRVANGDRHSELAAELHPA